MSKLTETLQSYRASDGIFAPATILVQLMHATDSETLEDFLQWCVNRERSDEIRKQASYKASELMIEIEKLEKKLRFGISFQKPSMSSMKFV